MWNLNAVTFVAPSHFQQHHQTNKLNQEKKYDHAAEAQQLCPANIFSAQMTRHVSMAHLDALFPLSRRSSGKKKKAPDLGESICGSASTLREPDDNRLTFLTRQKFIWPSDGRSGAVGQAMIATCSPLYTAREMTPDEAVIHPGSEKSLAQKSSQKSNCTVYAQLDASSITNLVTFLLDLLY